MRPVLGAPRNAVQLFSLHQEVARQHERPAERHGRANGKNTAEDAREVVRRPRARAHDQPRPIRAPILENERPGRQIRAVPQRPAEDKKSVRLVPRHLVTVGDARKAGKQCADRDRLELGPNAPCAAMPAIVDEVVAVPPGAAGPHLDEPRPQHPPVTSNRDGVRGGPDRFRDELVARKRLRPLGAARAYRSVDQSVPLSVRGS